MSHDYDDPVFIISVASDILKVHPQTLRMYEREGLLDPNRSESKIRKYSERDLDIVRMIRFLTRDHGVNLAGVRIILKMRLELEKSRRRLVELGEHVSRDLDREIFEG